MHLGYQLNESTCFRQMHEQLGLCSNQVWNPSQKITTINRTETIHVETLLPYCTTEDTLQIAETLLPYCIAGLILFYSEDM
jgi:hypothetical protein